MPSSLRTPAMQIIATLLRHRCQVHVVTGAEVDQDFIRFVTLTDDQSGTRLTFFREFDEETCRKLGGYNAPVPLWHLAISFYDPWRLERAEARALLLGKPSPTPVEAEAERPHNPEMTRRWAEAIYGEWLPWVWEGEPETPTERAADLWHYRVFADSRDNWNPTIPRTWKDKDKVLALGWREYAPPPPAPLGEDGLPPI